MSGVQKSYVLQSGVPAGGVEDTQANPAHYAADHSLFPLQISKLRAVSAVDMLAVISCLHPASSRHHEVVFVSCGYPLTAPALVWSCR